MNGSEMARRQLEGIALVRADLRRDDEAITTLANTGDAVTLAALAHTFAQVIGQTFSDPDALLDALTRVYTAAMVEESP